MTTQWERRQDFLELGKSQIESLLKKFIPSNKIAAIKLMHSGLSNTNYLLQLDNDRKYILRINIRNSKAGKKEYNLAQFLEKESLVPKALYYSEQNAELEHPFAIYEYRSGVPLSTKLDKTTANKNLLKTYYNLGLFLGNLATRYPFNQAGLLTETLQVTPVSSNESIHNPLVAFIVDCLDKEIVAQRLGPKLCEKLKAFVVAHNNEFPDDSDGVYLVHGDFKPENILISDDDKLTAILDWEFAYAGSTFGDIAILFRQQYKNEAELKLAFAEGCKVNGILLDFEWEKTAKLTDLINLCDFLNSTKDRPKLYANVINHIQNIMEFVDKI